LDALHRFEGDGLIFLPGQREIETACGLLRDALGTQVAVHALYGAVARKAQDAALRPDPAGPPQACCRQRHCRDKPHHSRCAVRCGFRPCPTPNLRSVRGITRLETKPASRASIDQRRGRAGRTAPGDCIRLWRREEEGGRPAQDRPEILDADLAKLRLDMALWGALDRTGLPFLDPPPVRAWDEAGRLLKVSARWTAPVGDSAGRSDGASARLIHAWPLMLEQAPRRRGERCGMGGRACWRAQ
jgi:ATP-dependent helicase HrpB